MAAHLLGPAAHPALLMDNAKEMSAAGAGVGAEERDPIDYEALADVLKAMAYPARLELLGKLRVSQTLREIQLTPRRGARDASPARTAARQTVQRHLDKLVENRLVRAVDAPPGGRDQISYVANPATFYSVIEALRSLLVRYAGFDLGLEHTHTGGHTRAASPVTGPRLVLVHGVYEGKAFPLSEETARHGKWTIGRARRVPVSLDYDPFVSRESAVVTRSTAGFAITDLGSKNGTLVNWSRLAAGDTRPLAPADVVSVGRSLLVFTP